jgi:hypothetical protein
MVSVAQWIAEYGTVLNNIAHNREICTGSGLKKKIDQGDGFAVGEYQFPNS